MMDVVRGCCSAQLAVDEFEDVRGNTKGESVLQDGGSSTSYGVRADVPSLASIL